jgi:uncharacterized membrane protein YgcG
MFVSRRRCNFHDTRSRERIEVSMMFDEKIYFIRRFVVQDSRRAIFLDDHDHPQNPATTTTRHTEHTPLQARRESVSPPSSTTNSSSTPPLQRECNPTFRNARASTSTTKIARKKSMASLAASEGDAKSADAAAAPTTATSIPMEMICCITGEIMEDPVSTVDGQTYERKAIEKWFSRGRITSPFTGAKLGTSLLTPNYAMKRTIVEFLETTLPHLTMRERLIPDLEVVIKLREEDLLQLKGQHNNERARLGEEAQAKDALIEINAKEYAEKLRENQALLRQKNEQLEQIRSEELRRSRKNKELIQQKDEQIEQMSEQLRKNEQLLGRLRPLVSKLGILFETGSECGPEEPTGNVLSIVRSGGTADGSGRSAADGESRRGEFGGDSGSGSVHVGGSGGGGGCGSGGGGGGGQQREVDIYVDVEMRTDKGGPFQYTGSVLAEKAHGMGSAKYDDLGDVYQGEFENGLRHGKGTYTYANGDAYTGDWSKGKMHGHGALTVHASKDEYTGNFVDGELNGKVSIAYGSGEKYVGGYRGGKKSGVGRYKYASGDQYDGGWLENMMHGQGNYSVASGDKYAGGFVKNKKHGKGTYMYKSGGSCTGTWVEGKRHGKFSFKLANGELNGDVVFPI